MWSDTGDGGSEAAKHRSEFPGGDAVTITIEQRDGVSILRLEGDLTSQSNLKANLEPLVDRRSNRIVLDLSRVPMISSGSLTDLMEMTARANSRGSRLVLLSPSPFVEGVLATTKLDKYFDVHGDLDSALRALK